MRAKICSLFMCAVCYAIAAALWLTMNRTAWAFHDAAGGAFAALETLLSLPSLASEFERMPLSAFMLLLGVPSLELLMLCGRRCSATMPGGSASHGSQLP